MPSMLKPEELERIRVEATVDERTMYKVTARQFVRSDVRARIEKAAARLGLSLPRGFFVHAADESAA